MHFEHQGRQYHMIRASDLWRDGMGLELHEGGRAVAEVFYSDITQDFALSVFQPAVPLATMETLIHAARASLPPAAQEHRR